MENQNLRGAEPEYTMQVVVDRTGVPGDTIRSWERRYGVPNPVRDATSQRMYSENDIRTIGWMRDQRDSGRSLPDIVAEFRLSGLSDLTPPTTPVLRPHFTITESSGPARSAHSRGVESLLAFEPVPINTLFAEIVVTQGGPHAAFSFLLPIAIEIQVRFDEGEVREIARMFAHSWIRRRLLALLTANESEATGKTLLAIAVGSTTNDVPLLCHAIDLAHDGYRVMTFDHQPAVSDLLRLIDEMTPCALILCADTETLAWEALQISRLVDETPSKTTSGTAIAHCGTGFQQGDYFHRVAKTVILPDHRGGYRTVLAKA